MFSINYHFTAPITTLTVERVKDKFSSNNIKFHVETSPTYFEKLSNREYMRVSFTTPNSNLKIDSSTLANEVTSSIRLIYLQEYLNSFIEKIQKNSLFSIDPNSYPKESLNVYTKKEIKRTHSAIRDLHNLLRTDKLTNSFFKYSNDLETKNNLIIEGIKQTISGVEASRFPQPSTKIFLEKSFPKKKYLFLTIVFSLFLSIFLTISIVSFKIPANIND
jgi:hypothetical protein